MDQNCATKNGRTKIERSNVHLNLIFYDGGGDQIIELLIIFYI